MNAMYVGGGALMSAGITMVSCGKETGFIALTIVGTIVIVIAGIMEFNK